MIRIRSRAHTARPSSVHRATVRAVRGQDHRDRAVVGPGRRGAGVHREGALPGARLDRVDAGLPVRLGAPAVRRDGRAGVPGSRTTAHGGADGAAPHARRCPRPRLQQRLYLWNAVAPGARGAVRRGRMGTPLLRARAQGQRRGTGAQMDAAAGRRLHPLLQRRALALRRHRPFSARAGARVRARPAAHGGAGRAYQPDRSARPPRASDGAVQRLLRTRARSSTCAGVSRTRACSTWPMAPTAAPARSRATLRSRRGPAAWRGRCWGSPNRSNSWRPSRTRRWTRPAAAPLWTRCCSARRA